jgi:hypothetical protein
VCARVHVCVHMYVCLCVWKCWNFKQTCYYKQNFTVLCIVEGTEFIYSVMLHVRKGKILMLLTNTFSSPEDGSTIHINNSAEYLFEIVIQHPVVFNIYFRPTAITSHNPFQFISLLTLLYHILFRSWLLVSLLLTKIYQLEFNNQVQCVHFITHESLHC